MGQVVYADLLFLVNFSMDFLCFFVTVRLLRRPFRGWRCVLAAAMGGIYSVAILFVSMNSILALIADLGFCALMCLCAYGIKDKRIGEFFLHTTVYFGVSMGTGGCMTAMYSLLNRMDLPLSEVEKNPDGISVWLFGFLAIASGAVALWGGNLFKSSSANKISVIEITYGGANLTVRGMTDTGNMLKDPISGKPIIIVEYRSLSGLLSQNTVEKAMRGDISGVINDDPAHKVRLIPMHTASGRSMVCAFVPEKIKISTVVNRTRINKKGMGANKSIEADVLFAPGRLCLSSDKIAGGCAALLPTGLT